MEIGLIGFGRFGRFAWQHLRKSCRVSVYDRSAKSVRPATRVTLRMAASKPIVLLCVPISELQNVCKRIAPHLKTGTLVIDTCSVKEHPLKILQQTLPPDIEILGTHPLFGPDSGKDGITGLKIVLCPIRTRHLSRVRAFLRRLGLRVLVATAADHDRAMARTQALFHFIARATAELGFEPIPLSTPGPDFFLRAVASVQNDTDQLFYDLQTLNRYAPVVRRSFIRQLTRIDRRLRAKG